MSEKKVKKIKKIKKVAETNVVKKVATQDIKDYSSNEKISFCRVTDLNKEDYKNFTSEKYKYGMIFYDFEVFAYDWLVVFIDVIRNKKTIIVNDRPSFLRFYQEHRNEIFSGYNSRQYDTTIAKSIILGLDVKEVNDKLIIDGLKPFQISDKFKDVKWYDYDCLPNGTFISLKTKEGFMGDDIRETEVDFNLDRTLTKEEIEDTIYYCNHDVEETIKVFQKESIGKYQAHMGLIEMYNFDLSYINKTSAQITASITKCQKPKESRKDDWDWWLVDTIDLHKYKFIADWFMSLRDNHPERRIEKYINGEFVEYIGKDAPRTKNGYELHVDICGVPHICAMGGIHGCPDKPIYVEKKGMIAHSDVNSLYPSIMIQYNLLTRSATEPEEFENAYNLRIKYKKEGNPLNKILKVPLNAQYGVMGDINSPAYDMRNCRMVCITGQLLIITLLEKLEPYINLIQSNTDGIIYTIKNHERDYETVMNIISDWEKSTRLGFTTDWIDWIEQGQVNGYAFQFSNGEYERKGAYLKENTELDNDLPIINEVMFEHIAHKVDIKKYIEDCDDLIKFQKIVRVQGDYKFTVHNNVKDFNKTYRVFASKDINNSALLKCKYEIGEQISDDKGNVRIYKGEKFANTPEHCIIVNEDIHNKKCGDYNIDKQWYIDLAMDRLEKQFNISCKPNIFDM